MKKIILALSLLLSMSAFADDDVQIVADIRDYQAKVGKPIKIQSLHNIHIENKSGHKKEYNYQYCLVIGPNKTCSKMDRIILDKGKKYVSYDTYTRYVQASPDEVGVHIIKSITLVNFDRVEASGTVTVTK